MSWLIPEEENVFPGDLSLRLDSQIFLYSINGSEDVILSEIYGIKGKNTRPKKIGNWSKSQGLAVLEPQIYERRKNLSRVTLINAINEWNPICTINWDSDGNMYAGGLFGAVHKVLQSVIIV